MRTVGDIYEAYRIPPWLQEHQLRVAAVGRMVCGIQQQVDERQVVLAGLFHDMGNILKFDLSPDGPLAMLIDGKGIAYWQGVKNDFERMYGTDEHEAAISIARELHLPETVITIMDSMRFSQAEKTKNEGSRELWVTEYADMRVGPFGVIPMRERLDNLHERYASRWTERFGADMEANFRKNSAILEDIESELFRDARLQPGDITDVSAAPLIEELKKYEIS